MNNADRGGASDEVNDGRGRRCRAFWPVCRRVLRAQEVDVVVLEARDRVGGRTSTMPIGDGKVVESAASGGSWSGGESSPDSKSSSQKRSTPTERQEPLRARRSIEFLPRAIPRVNPLALVDVQLAMNTARAHGPTVPTDEPWKAPKRLCGFRDGGFVDQTPYEDRLAIAHRLGLRAVWAAIRPTSHSLHFLALPATRPTAWKV